jgi:hypothetical protein
MAGFLFCAKFRHPRNIYQNQPSFQSLEYYRDMKKLIPLLILATTSSFAGVYVENLWRNDEVTTCFAEGEQGRREDEGYVLKVRPWKEKHKAKVKQWVTEEYSAERTGIYFTGFEDCEETPNADVIIFHNKNSSLGTFIFGGIHGLALIGPYPGSVKGYPAASAFVSISSSGMDKGTVIHEFGHSAGLHHEHIHYDAFKLDKGRCPSITKDNSSFTTRLRYTDYDPHSVMNYCQIQSRGGSHAGLSAKDVELLKKLYP